MKAQYILLEVLNKKEQKSPGLDVEALLLDQCEVVLAWVHVKDLHCGEGHWMGLDNG